MKTIASGSPTLEGKVPRTMPPIAKDGDPVRIALGVEYDGTAYSGWQRLSHRQTVQGVLERALSFVANESITVGCAGRTDAGVHARCQVVHFDSEANRGDGWLRGTNSNLPGDVAVRWAQVVDGEFHSRYSATARSYRYTIINRAVRPALEARFATWIRAPLDAAAMHGAAQDLIGENDFSAFRTIACQSRTPMRNVHSITVTRNQERVIVDIQANAFLHHMVRNIVGSLLPIGRGERPQEWLAQLLAGKNRDLAGPTAPATGLCFLGPWYPSRFCLPFEVSG